jgi:hypothetical protein
VPVAFAKLALELPYAFAELFDFGFRCESYAVHETTELAAHEAARSTAGLIGPAP